jgi:hypothetical protein
MTTNETTPRYTASEVETSGFQAVGTFYGVHRQGWIMLPDTFVDYAGFAQLVIPLADGVDVKRHIWHPASATPDDREEHEIARALGYDSIEEMHASVRRNDQRAQEYALAKAYQASPEAEHRRNDAAATLGITPERIVWVEPAHN